MHKIPEKTYNELLQNKFNQIVGTPKWAQLDKTDQDDGNDSDSEILKHSNHIVPINTKKLAKGVIDIKALTEINKQTQNEGNMITSLQFHETSTVAFIAGLKGILSVFQVRYLYTNTNYLFYLFIHSSISIYIIFLSFRLMAKKIINYRAFNSKDFVLITQNF